MWKRLVPIIAFLIFVPQVDGKAGFTVRGTVYDETHAVIPGASVQIYSEENDQEGKTDSQGIFQFESMPPGTYEIEVRAIGFITRFQEFQVGDKDPNPISITLTVHGVPCCDDDCFQPDISYTPTTDKPTMTGIVTNSSGTPISKASVTLSKMPNDGKIATLQSGGKGEFMFGDLSPGRYHLVVSQAGYYYKGFANVRVRPGKNAYVTVVLTEGSDLQVCQ